MPVETGIQKIAITIDSGVRSHAFAGFFSR